MQDSSANIKCGGFVRETKPPALTSSAQPKPEAQPAPETLPKPGAQPAPEPCDEFGCPKAKLSEVPIAISRSRGQSKRLASTYQPAKGNDRFKQFQTRQRRDNDNPRPKRGPRPYVREDNYGGLPDWKCTCGASVWPRKEECFKCGARRSDVTGRDSLGYNEALRKHKEEEQRKKEQEQARHCPQPPGLIARTPKSAPTLMLEPSSPDSDDKYRRRDVPKRCTTGRFADPSEFRGPRQDMKRYRRLARKAHQRSRFADVTFAAGTDKKGKVVMVQAKPVRVGGFQRGKRT